MNGTPTHRSVFISLAVNCCEALALAVAALVSGAVALRSHVAANAADVAIGVFLLIGVLSSARPPDDSHPLGYGRDGFSPGHATAHGSTSAARRRAYARRRSRKRRLRADDSRAVAVEDPVMSTAPQPTRMPRAFGRDDSVRRAESRTVFGQVMGLVACTCLFCAVGAYIGRGLQPGTGLVAFLIAFGALFGLRAATARSQQLAITLLFAIGLLLGVGLGPTIEYYAGAHPGVVYQAAAATGLFIAAFGAYGYATRRDLSSWGRTLFFALIALIAFGLATLFVTIPAGNVIYAVLGLVLFAALTIYDFNRLRRLGMEQPTLIAASIFLDIVNVFQFMLLLFAGGRRN
jgi:FtsH-binding integral membrane protein